MITFVRCYSDSERSSSILVNAALIELLVPIDDDEDFLRAYGAQGRMLGLVREIEIDRLIARPPLNVVLREFDERHVPHD